MSVLNLDNAKIGLEKYGGSEAKLCLVCQNITYMIKKPEYVPNRKNDLTAEFSNNIYSEYIGSHIMKSLGLPVHKTFIGTFKGQYVVACKDFTPDDKKSVECNLYFQETFPSNEIGRVPSYKQLYELHEKCLNLNKIRELSLNRYWETLVGDSLIGNFDRHKGNWGYLVDKNTGEVSLAPVYDCGSSLYARLSEEGMQKVMNDPTEINKRVFEFPKTALNKNDDPHKINKFTYQELLSGEFYDEYCMSAFEKIYPYIDLNKINNIIEDTPTITPVQVEFYKTMIKARKELLIDSCYKQAQDNGFVKRLVYIPETKIDKQISPNHDSLEVNNSVSNSTPKKIHTQTPSSKNLRK